MTTANKLTMLRMLLIPVFLLLMHLSYDYARMAAFAVFAIASITDFVDGYIARHYNQITNFGKFMDPLADKMLVVSAMCCFVRNGQMEDWMLAIVLLREFAISGMRLIAAERGEVIAAAWSGKVKTAATMVCICLMLLAHESWMPFSTYVDPICNCVIVGTTLYSGIEYLYKNRKLFREGV